MPQARKVALVSGGSRGLGAELVSGFLDRQYGVATLSRTKTTFITNMLRARKGRHFHWSQVDGRDHEALRAFVMRVAWEHDQKMNSGCAALAMNFSSDSIQEVTELNLEIHSGAGCAIDPAADKLVRDAQIWTHLAGDSVQRMKAARRIGR